jgi:NADH:ubiquinone reductase (H+-translocating)
VPTRSRVVIIGAGFGGLQAAQSLAGSNTEVLLIDRNNYHTFVPLLYQVATAQIEPEQIAYPVRTLVRRSSNIRFLMAEVKRIDFDQQIIETDRMEIAYNFLVLATGSQTQFHGVPGASEYAFTLRTLEEAVSLRNHLFACFEQAVQEFDPLRRQQLLTFVIVGGGATGVELAGALVEIVRGILPRDYPSLNKERVKIIMVQSGDRLLPDLPEKLGIKTGKELQRFGVNLYLQTKVSRVTPESVHLQDNQMIPAATVIWTAGLEAAYPEPSEPLADARKGKLQVESTLRILGRSNVYAIGDVADVQQNGEPLVGVAPEALQQGVAVARNIKRQLRGKAPKPFHYFNKGRLAIVGCQFGVGKIAGISFSGFLAWFMWLGVHLVYLPGFRNRLLVLLNWFHTYLMGDRAARVIVRQEAGTKPRKLLPVQVSSLSKSR